MTETRAPYRTVPKQWTRSPIAGSCSLMSKMREMKPENCPTWFEWGLGSKVGVDGKTYTDWESGMLSITLGHAHHAVDAAVQEAMALGITSLPLGHRLEYEVAEKILDLSGCRDHQARFMLSGSTACSAAVRVARAITGKKIVLSNGYHGIDSDLMTTPPAWGIVDPPPPASVKSVAGKAREAGRVLRTIPFNDAQAFENACFGLDPDPGYAGGEDPTIHADKIAAIILETETLDSPEPGYLEKVRALCDKYHICMILDECISAGRGYTFTAWQDYGVEPDLWVTSKCLANGMPLSVLVGKREWMRAFDLDFRPDYATENIAGPVYVSGTYHVPGLSLAAARATLDVWARESVGPRIEDRGYTLRKGLESEATAANLGVTLKGHHYRIVLDTDPLSKTFLMRHMLDAGHLTGAGWNLNAAHSDDDVASAIAAFGSALHSLAKARENGTVAEYAGRVIAQPYRPQA